MQFGLPKKTTLQAREKIQVGLRDWFFLASLSANFDCCEDITLTSEALSDGNWLGLRGGFSTGGGQWRGVSEKNLAKTPLNYVEARNCRNLTRKIDFLGASGLRGWVVLVVFRFPLGILIRCLSADR